MSKIGIDVGGTNTDALLLDGTSVLAAVKTGTTADVTSGIATALAQLLEQPGVDRGAIEAVIIGTTHFTNAVVARQGLRPVRAVRVCLPASAAIRSPTTVEQGCPMFAAKVKKVIRLCGASIGSTTCPAKASSTTSSQLSGGPASRSAR